MRMASHKNNQSHASRGGGSGHCGVYSSHLDATFLKRELKEKGKKRFQAMGADLAIIWVPNAFQT